MSGRPSLVARSLRFLLCLGALTCSGAALTRPARADGTLISAPTRFDFTHDAARGLVYISSGSQVLRYRLSDGTWLSPIDIGGRAQGIDISPDGSTLAIADGQTDPNALGAGQPGGRVVFVNLDTLVQTPKGSRSRRLKRGLFLWLTTTPATC